MKAGRTAASRGRHFVRGTLVLVAIFAAGLIASGAVAGAGPLAAFSALSSAADDTGTDPATTETTTDTTTTSTDTTEAETTSAEPTESTATTEPTETTNTETTPTSPACVQTGNETIATDQADYSPEQTVHMTGAGYAASCDVVVKVTRPNGSVVVGDGSFQPGSDTVTTGTDGSLTYDYILNGVLGEYRVEALGAADAVLATTTFSDHQNMSVEINANAAETNTLAVTLNLSWSGSGGDPSQGRFANDTTTGNSCSDLGTGTWSAWEAVTDAGGNTATKTWTLASGVGGTRKVCVETAHGAIGTPTGPEADDDSILLTTRQFTAVISPTSATTGTATSYTLTVTNTSDDSSVLGCVRISVPTGAGTPSSIGVVATDLGPSIRSWNTPILASGVIQTTRSGGPANDIDVGGTIVITFNTTASTSGTKTWTTNAFGNTSCNTAASIEGSQPSVVVTDPDNTAPTGSVSINSGAGYTNSTAVTLNLAATDGVGVTAYRVANGADCSAASWVTVPSNPSFSADIAHVLIGADETKTVCAQYRDAALNPSSTYTDTIGLDTTAPAISCTVPNQSIWYASNVTVNCTASDGGSGLANAADASFSLSTSVGPGVEDATALTGSKTVADAVGNSDSVGPYTFKVDRKAPAISCTVPNQSIWYASNVTVNCTASDGGSGLANAADASFSLSTSVGPGVEDATALTGSKTVADAVGNSDSVGPYTFKVDRKAPAISCTVPNQSIWYASNVTVNCTASDGGSGLANAADASFSLSTSVGPGVEDATALTGSKTVADAVGNSDSVGPYTFKVDRKAPAISCTVPNQSIWYASNVTVNCTASDGGSGLANAADASFSLSTSVGPGVEDATALTGSKTVADAVGNSDSVGPYTFKVDRKAPAISCTVPNQSIWYASNVTVNCTASDGGSGLANAADASFSLSTSVGPGVEDATALTGSKTVADAVGNSDSVGPYTFKVDRKAPAISCTVPNQSIWYASNVTVNCTASDGGSGLANAADASFSLSTSVGPGVEDATALTGSKTVADAVGNSDSVGPYTFKVDRKAPAISCTVPNQSIWYASNVTVNCTASDGGSGLANAADASFSLSTSVGPGVEDATALTGSKTVADAVGNSDSVGPYTFKVDRKAPAISCTVPNQSIWYASNVTVNCTASDGGSGLANAADASFSLSTSVGPGVEDATALTGSKTVADAVGNSDSVGPYTFKVDRKAPAISCTVPNQSIWYASNVTVNCTASDGGSGLANAADASFSLSTSVGPGVEDATALTGSKTVADAVGNSDSVGPYTFKVDRKAPVVSCGAPDGNWHAADVSIGCTAVDNGSGLAVPGDTAFDLTTSVPNGTETANASTNSHVVADAVGNSATAGPIAGNKVDKKGPVVTLSCPTTVILGSTASANWSATDGGSGVQPGLGSGSIALDTSSVGPKTGTVVAGASKDNVDNPSPAATCSYSVIFNFHGFFQPVDNNGVFNVVNSGRAIPVKFDLSGNQGLAIFATGYPKSTPVACNGGATTDVLEETSTAGNSSLTYSEGQPFGQYHYVWKTEKVWANTCRRLDLKFIDGMTYSALFMFTK